MQLQHYVTMPLYFCLDSFLTIYHHLANVIQYSMAISGTYMVLTYLHFRSWNSHWNMIQYDPIWYTYRWLHSYIIGFQTFPEGQKAGQRHGRRRSSRAGRCRRWSDWTDWTGCLVSGIWLTSDVFKILWTIFIGYIDSWRISLAEDLPC